MDWNSGYPPNTNGPVPWGPPPCGPPPMMLPDMQPNLYMQPPPDQNFYPPGPPLQNFYPPDPSSFGPPPLPPNTYMPDPNYMNPYGPPPPPMNNYGPPPNPSFQPPSQFPPPPPPSSSPYGVPYSSTPPNNGYAAQPMSNYPPPPPQSQLPPQQQQFYPQGQQVYSNQAQPSATFHPLNGRKKALLIGINYTGTTAELRGCINDVRRMKDFLCRQYGFRDSPDAMVILTDDQRDPSRIPTKANMLNAMRWLVSGAMPGDSLFFHYSGHGGQQRDTNGDEVDGFDETIMPVDFRRAGQIVDDDMHDIMVKPLQAGVRLTVVFDSCHSGTALDLPYIYDVNGMIQSPGRLGVSDVTESIMGIGHSLMSGRTSHAISALTSGLQRAKYGKKAQKHAEQTKTSRADVVMLSGCRDEQTSVDANIGGMATGALSYALIESLKGNARLSYQKLLESMRNILSGRFKQIPQLSTGHPMDMSQLFAI